MCTDGHVRDGRAEARQPTWPPGREGGREGGKQQQRRTHVRADTLAALLTAPACPRPLRAPRVCGCGCGCGCLAHHAGQANRGGGGGGGRRTSQGPPCGRCWRERAGCCKCGRVRNRQKQRQHSVLQEWRSTRAQAAAGPGLYQLLSRRHQKPMTKATDLGCHLLVETGDLPTFRCTWCILMRIANAA